MCIVLQLTCIFSQTPPPPPFFSNFSYPPRSGAHSLLCTQLRPFWRYKHSYQQAHTSPPAHPPHPAHQAPPPGPISPAPKLALPGPLPHPTRPHPALHPNPARPRQARHSILTVAAWPTRPSHTKKGIVGSFRTGVLT